MTPVEEFESLLKDVVNAKRLSASKMTSLTDLVMKNVEHDTQLVSVLYRTHKSLSSTTAKIWSLYVFDALSRAAKSYVIKHNVSGDIFTQPGNPATFLLKIGGLLEGVFQDMINTGNSGAKEKTKKIYDIWVKGNTFPSTVLSQLADVLKRLDEVPKVNPPPANIETVTPLISISTAPVVQAPVQAMDPQAALLALLTQAAASSSMTASPSQTITSVSQLDAAQLAVLQQLAHTAAPVPSIPQSLPFADPVNVQKFPSSGVNGSSRPIPEVRSIITNEQRHSGYRSSEHESRTTSHSDDRDSIRGRYRTGNFRGRGRGDRFGRNWDGDDYRHKDLDRDTRSPRSSRGGRDRSKSPSRNGDKWGSRFTSPPRRPRDASPMSTQTSGLSVGRGNEPDKDEFGRDIRPESHDSPAHTISLTHLPISPPPILDPRKSPIDASNGPHTTLDENPVTLLSSNKLPSTTLDSDSNIPKRGLESFNPATFDCTSSTSWDALGNMWQVTHGCLPSQEHLMQFVVSQQMASTFQPSNQSFDQQNFTSFRGRGRGRGFSRGRGGSSYGNGRGAVDGWGNEDDSETCAVVLGGGEGAANDEGTASSDHGTSEPSAQQNHGSGCMQKVGDRWVYVRGTTDHNTS